MAEKLKLKKPPALPGEPASDDAENVSTGSAETDGSEPETALDGTDETDPPQAVTPPTQPQSEAESVPGKPLPLLSKSSIASRSAELPEVEIDELVPEELAADAEPEAVPEQPPEDLPLIPEEPIETSIPAESSAPDLVTLQSNSDILKSEASVQGIRSLQSSFDDSQPAAPSTQEVPSEELLETPSGSSIPSERDTAEPGLEASTKQQYLPPPTLEPQLETRTSAELPVSTELGPGDNADEDMSERLSGVKSSDLEIAPEEEPAVEAQSATLETPEHIVTRRESEIADTMRDAVSVAYVPVSPGDEEISIPAGYPELREILDDDKKDYEESSPVEEESPPMEPILPSEEDFPETVPETETPEAEFIDSISEPITPRKTSSEIGEETAGETILEMIPELEIPQELAQKILQGPTPECPDTPGQLSDQVVIIDTLLGIERYPCNHCNTIPAADTENIHETVSGSIQYATELLGQLVDIVVSKFKNNNQNSSL